VLKVADPLIFGQIVDAAVLSVRRDFSQIPKVYEACERLRTVGVKVLGAVVNGVNDKPMRRSAPTSV
jgi:Mrp family chromosome partitioning ATPase